MNWNLFIGIVIIVAFVALGIIVGIKTKKINKIKYLLQNKY